MKHYPASHHGPAPLQGVSVSHERPALSSLAIGAIGAALFVGGLVIGLLVDGFSQLAALSSQLVR